MTMLTWGRIRGEHGAAATEFALVVPVLILLFFGIVFFGLTIFRQQVVESATREAGRIMAVGADPSEIESALDGAAPAFRSGELNVVDFGRDGSSVGGAPGAPPCDGSASTATVVARAEGARLDFTIPFWSGGGYDARFEATATFRCEV